MENELVTYIFDPSKLPPDFFRSADKKTDRVTITYHCDGNQSHISVANGHCSFQRNDVETFSSQEK